MPVATTSESGAPDEARLHESQLRIATAGSVDDGKSTLIGRLLHDTKTIFEDQLAAVERASRRYGDLDVNLALLTDGLRAEREQGITIDVAYRYFATPRRSFVLADTPGHVQYTRNMVTGASIADVAIVLVDARHGVVEQTRRHLGIASLLRVHHIVLAVNKMDLVDWDEGAFDAAVAAVRALLAELDGAGELSGSGRLHAVPVSALHGDNVVERSPRSPWYEGPALLELLETVTVDDLGIEPLELGARLGVQWVIRSGSDYRGYAGSLSGGPLAVGDEVVVLPGGARSTVGGITRAGDAADRAEPGDAIAVTLSDHVDVGRGDVIAAVAVTLVAPRSTIELIADACWFVDAAVRPGSRFVAKHLARQVNATVTEIVHRLDPVTLAPTSANELELNDLGRLRLSLSEPIVADRYCDHRDGGRLVLVDETTNATVAALMIVEVL